MIFFFSHTFSHILHIFITDGRLFARKAASALRMRQRSTRVRRAVAVSVKTPGVALGAQKEQKKCKKEQKKSKKVQKRAQIGVNRVK
jgi:hypothetical protein